MEFAYQEYEKENPEEIILPGDVIEVTPTGKYQKTTGRFSQRIVGIAVEKPTSNENESEEDSDEESEDTTVLVATYGRVETNIIGLCCIGDILVSSQQEGKAMSYDRTKAISGTVLGKVVGLTSDVHKVVVQIMLS